jgi:hypothetical protein
MSRVGNIEREKVCFGLVAAFEYNTIDSHPQRKQGAEYIPSMRDNLCVSEDRVKQT